MKSEKEIEQIVRKFSITASSKMDKKVCDDVSDIIKKHKNTSVTVNQSPIWRIIMKSNITKLTAAAVILIACLLGLTLWRSTGSGITLADVLTSIEQVSAYEYKMSSKGTRQQSNIGAISTLLISKEYGIKQISKLDDPNNDDTPGYDSYLLPRQNSIIYINHSEKTYVTMKYDGVKLDYYKAEYGDPQIIIQQILDCNHISIGQSIVDGITAEGFQTKDLTYKGGFFGQDDYFVGSYKQVDVKLWVDVKTYLPVKLEEDIIMENGRHINQICSDFKWNVIVNADDFVPNIPGDYTSPIGDVIIPAFNEETAIKGLRQFEELAGKYPVSLELNQLSEEAAKVIGFEGPESMVGLSDDEKTEQMSRLILLGSPGLLYQGLLDDNKDPVYYGYKVGTDDTTKILLRWKLDDGQYRVIFGDLSVKTITPEELAELEKQ